MVKKYLGKLNTGGKSSSAFVPTTGRKNKSSLINSLVKENRAFVNSPEKWNETDLDRYLLPHPLLGKLYVREMLYFTIYHTQHHLRAIKKQM